MAYGVLALQGDFEAHARAIGRLGRTPLLVRTTAELERVDAIILPGGESSTMLRLLGMNGLGDELTRRIRDGMPTLATCAGVVLLARVVVPCQPSLGLLDVDVERNAYGRQVHSGVTEVEVASVVGGGSALEGVFIRAPRITRVGDTVEVLGRRGPDPVLVRQGHVLAATFHPELTSDARVHTLFFSIGGAHGG